MSPVSDGRCWPVGKGDGIKRYVVLERKGEIGIKGKCKRVSVCWEGEREREFGM